LKSVYHFNQFSFPRAFANLVVSQWLRPGSGRSSLIPEIKFSEFQAIFWLLLTAFASFGILELKQK
jgi:hypothetical protein